MGTSFTTVERIETQSINAGKWGVIERLFVRVNKMDVGFHSGLFYFEVKVRILEKRESNNQWQSALTW